MAEPRGGASQALDAVVEVLAAPLDQAVAVDEEGLVECDGLRHDRARAAARTEDQGLRRGDHLDLAVRAKRAAAGDARR